MQGLPQLCAGGCFWGLELAYQREPGVTKTSVGYTQGDVEAPSYQAVCSGATGHTEAVQVRFATGGTTETSSSWGTMRCDWGSFGNGRHEGAPTLCRCSSSVGDQQSMGVKGHGGKRA